MGKGRAIISLIVNGFFFFILPSLIFYGFHIVGRLTNGEFQAMNLYLPKISITLFNLPLGSMSIPLGLKITITSVLGLVITFIAVISCLVSDGNTETRKAKVLGGIKYVVAIGWTWTLYHQLSRFSITLGTITATVLIYWRFYLITGMLIFLFLAIANFLSATSKDKTGGKGKEPEGTKTSKKERKKKSKTELYIKEEKKDLNKSKK